MKNINAFSIQIDDHGNFIHFLPAPNENSLPKHVVFLLDTSRSMKGKKLDQLKNAMYHILDRLSPNDYFNLLHYDSNVVAYYFGRPLRNVVTKKVGTNYPIKHGSGIDEEMIQDLPQPFRATSSKISQAKQIITGLRASGATNIYDALKLALHLSKLSEELSDLQRIVIFLADGRPTVGYTNLQAIINMTKDANNDTKKISLYALSFGNDADEKFLRQVSAVNSGFMKNIYEADDVSEQIEGLFDRVSAPVLSDIDFEYVNNDMKTTVSKFNVLNKGQELVLMGKLPNQNNTFLPQNFKVKAKGFYGEREFSPKIVKVRENRLERIRDYGKLIALIHASMDARKYSKEARDLAFQVKISIIISLNINSFTRFLVRFCNSLYFVNY